MISNTAALILAKNKRPEYQEFDLTKICFSEQLAFVKDKNRLVCAQTTVRAGKTTGIALKFQDYGTRYKNVMMPYIALTRDSAKNIMWPILQERYEQLKIPCDFTESDLTCTFRNTGASVKLFGADMKNFMVRLKGIKTPFAAVDEGQDFRSHLGELIDILIARTSEYEDGQVCLTGTPGMVPRGYFFDASQGLEGFSKHYWTLYDNKFFPKAREFVEDLKRRKNWSNDHPTLQREYYGKWYLDLEAMVFQYEEKRNNYEELPKLTDYCIGIDLGYNDADAIAVLGWHTNKKECYLVEEFVQNKLTITELMAEVDQRLKKYPHAKVVIDTGGLGLKISEEINRRTGVPTHAAEKSRKTEHITWLNDALRTNRFYARSNSRFAEDCAIVEWDYDKSTSDKLVIKKEPHSDICDAVLYAFVEAQHWLSEIITPPSTDPIEVARLESIRMLKEDEENFIREQNQDWWEKI